MQGNYYQEYRSLEFPTTLGDILQAEGENLQEELDEVVWAASRQKALRVRELEERLLSLWGLNGQLEAEIQAAVDRQLAEFPELDSKEVESALREEILWSIGAGIEAEIAELRSLNVLIAERELEREEQQRERLYREAVRLFFSESWIGGFLRGLALWKGVDSDFVRRLVSFAEFVPLNLDVKSHLPKIRWAKIKKFRNRSFLVVDKLELLDLNCALKAVRRFFKKEAKRERAYIRALQEQRRQELKRKLKQIRKWLFELKDRNQWNFYRLRANQLWNELKEKQKQEWEQYSRWKKQRKELLEAMLKKRIMKLNRKQILKKKQAIRKKAILPVILTRTTRSGMVGVGRTYSRYPSVEQRVYEWLLNLWKKIPLADVDLQYAYNLQQSLRYWVDNWHPDDSLPVIGKKKILERRIKVKLSKCSI